MSYVDGFLLAVPTANKDKYKQVSDAYSKIAIDHGALHIAECWGDDIPDGKVTDFKRAVQAKPDETVVFSWTVWPDKATRDKGGAAMKDDPRMKELEKEVGMPFDGERMVYGGFALLTETRAGGK